ncbi:hypothetical protein Hanom_Chr10g00882461 [Helianthus anomalus]
MLRLLVLVDCTAFDAHSCRPCLICSDCLCLLTVLLLMLVLVDWF